MTRRVVGQGEIYSRALRAARSLRLPHGLLISGSPGSGKSTATMQIAASLLCGQTSTEDSCGECGTCRRVQAEQHPDLHCLRLPEDRRDIPVEMVRDLRESLTLLPMEGRARVVVVDPADRLNEQGQNALLKTLEEPGTDTFLLLTTARPEGLLETVRSRVQRLRLRPLEDEEIRADFHGKNSPNSDHLESILPLARGSLGRARALLEPEARKAHELVVAFLDGTNHLGPVGLARELLAGAEGRSPAVGRARLALDLLGAESRRRLAALARSDIDAYPARPLDGWTASLELLFDAAAGLDLQIPSEQVLVALFLAWPRAHRP